MCLGCNGKMGIAAEFLGSPGCKVHTQCRSIDSQRWGDVSSVHRLKLLEYVSGASQTVESWDVTESRASVSPGL